MKYLYLYFIIGKYICQPLRLAKIYFLIYTTPTGKGLFRQVAIIMNKKIKDDSMMNQLLSQAVPLPQPDQIVKGRVIEIGKNTVFVDLGPVGTGIIMGREIKENQAVIKQLQPGEEISAMVLELENEDGFVELSLKAANKQTTWEELRSIMERHEAITTKIIKANKGGLMIEVKGIGGFLPVSQLSSENYPRVQDGDKTKILNELNKFVNKDMLVRIIDIDQSQQKLIVSEKALEEEKLKETLKNFQIGDVVEGTISGVVDFGAFVRINSPQKPEGEKEQEKSEIIEGLIHISEIDWQLIEDPRQILKVGQEVQAKIIGIGGDRLSLSLKALKKDPWLEIDEKYQKGQVIKGRVTKFNSFGAFIQLDKDIHGLIHISEFGSEENMKNSLEIDKEYELKILSIEPKVHKMALGLIKEEPKKEEV